MIDLIQTLESELRRWYLGALVGAIVVDQQVNEAEKIALEICVEEALPEWREELELAVVESRIPSFVNECPNVDKQLAAELLKNLVIVAMADGHFEDPERRYVTAVSRQLGLQEVADEFIDWAVTGLVWQRKGEELISRRSA